MDLSRYGRTVRQSAASPQRSLPLKDWLGRRWQILSLPLLAFLILPLLGLFLRTNPGQLVTNLGQPQVLQAIRVSLLTTVVATTAIILFGTPVAFMMARRRSPFFRLMDSLIDLPTVLPPAVAGVALLMAFGRQGLLGGLLEVFGIQIAFTQAAVVLAQMFIASPFYIKAASLGFSAIDPELEQAASLDGASVWQVFRFVIVPLSWTALLTGSVMSWARALGEFGATIIFAGNYPGRTQTMPLAIYIGFHMDLEVALTLSIIMVGFSFLVLLLVKGFLNRDGEGL